MTSTRKQGQTGFTLIELLVIVSIMLVLVSLSGVAVTSIASGTLLKRGAEMASGALVLARQEAVARNQAIEVRIYNIGTGSTELWQAMRILRIVETPGGQTNQLIGKTTVLPEGIVFSGKTDLSPLLVNGSVSGAEPLAGYGSAPRNYKGFRFGPGGAPDRRVARESNFVTVVRAHDQAKAQPDNYATLQVNTMTGKVSLLQP